MTISGRDCTNNLDSGEFLMIRGPSGGGKTTLLNLIGTADAATSGKLSNVSNCCAWINAVP